MFSHVLFRSGTGYLGKGKDLCDDRKGAVGTMGQGAISREQTENLIKEHGLPLRQVDLKIFV